MNSILYFMVLVIFFHQCKCYNRVRNNKLKFNEIENNMKMIMKPIEKLTGIFSNHDIEVQFDVEQPQYHTTGPIGLKNSQNQVMLNNAPYLINSTKTNPTKTDIPSPPLSNNSTTDAFHKDLIHGIRRSNDVTNPDKQIVYMKDLKEELEELEKKLLTKIKDGKYCNQQVTKNEMPPSSKISLDDILNTLAKSGPLQKEISKPSDEELSWLKIKLPMK